MILELEDAEHEGGTTCMQPDTPPSCFHWYALCDIVAGTAVNSVQICRTWKGPENGLHR